MDHFQVVHFPFPSSEEEVEQKLGGPSIDDDYFTDPSNFSEIELDIENDVFSDTGVFKHSAPNETTIPELPSSRRQQRATSGKEGRKEFACRFCDCTYNFPDELDTHLAISHCPQKSTSSSEGALESDMPLIRPVYWAGNEYMCVYCPSDFRRHDELIDHLDACHPLTPKPTPRQFNVVGEKKDEGKYAFADEFLEHLAVDLESTGHLITPVSIQHLMERNANAYCDNRKLPSVPRSSD